MPTEIFASCVGDLATLGGPVFVVTPVCSPLGSFSFLSAWPWELESFYPGSFPFRSGRVEFLRRGDGSKTHGGNARYLDTYSTAA